MSSVPAELKLKRERKTTNTPFPLYIHTYASFCHRLSLLRFTRILGKRDSTEKPVTLWYHASSYSSPITTQREIIRLPPGLYGHHTNPVKEASRGQEENRLSSKPDEALLLYPMKREEMTGGGMALNPRRGEGREGIQGISVARHTRDSPIP